MLLETMENGMIDVAEIWEECEIAERQSILNINPYKITQTKDGQWTTHYVKGGVRRQIKRKSKRVVGNPFDPSGFLALKGNTGLETERYYVEREESLHG